MRDLWVHRGLFRHFFWREVKGRYLGSVSGLFWALAHPLMQLAIYALVFTTIFRIRFPELSGHSFLAFAAVVLWPWFAFQEGLQRATVALQNHAQLIKRVAFPHEILVYAAVSATYAVHLTGFAFVLLALSLTGTPWHPSNLPGLFLILALQFVFSLGLGLVLGALQVFLRDIEHLLAPFFMVWFYLTPILYPLSLVPEPLSTWLALNPYTHVAEGIRALLLFPPWHPGAGVLALGAAALGIFWVGYVFFRRLSPYFEDFL